MRVHVSECIYVSMCMRVHVSECIYVSVCCECECVYVYTVHFTADCFKSVCVFLLSLCIQIQCVHSMSMWSDILACTVVPCDLFPWSPNMHTENLVSKIIGSDESLLLFAETGTVCLCLNGLETQRGNYSVYRHSPLLCRNLRQKQLNWLLFCGLAFGNLKNEFYQHWISIHLNLPEICTGTVIQFTLNYAVCMLSLETVISLPV